MPSPLRFALALVQQLFSPRRMPELTVRDVALRVDHKDVWIFDTSTEGQFARAHLPNARRIEAATFTEAELPDSRDDVLVFTGGGRWTGRPAFAARRAEALGYRNVFVLQAGTAGWKSAGKPLERGQARRAPPRASRGDSR